MAESTNQPSNRNLKDYVDELIELASSESLPEEDLKTVTTSCQQAISHNFEIAFAGLRSAGKSTTINALLERQLLYSQAGHATGTVCYIRPLSSSDIEENIKITFINKSQLLEEIAELCNTLGITNSVDITQPQVRENLNKELRFKKIDQGIPDKIAQSLQLLERLIEAYDKYQSYITADNTVITLTPINEENLKEAAEYAAWKNERGDIGGGSVIERIDYYCQNSLLDSGNILIDLPGIDAPIKRDRNLTKTKLTSEETGAVIFMPSSAYEGDLSQSEIEINSLIRDNTGVRSRVFFVFNRVDETLSDTQKKNKFEQSLQNNFSFLNDDHKDETKRIYRTSALLGFYSGLIQKYIDDHGIEAIDIPDTIEDGITLGNTKIPKQYFVSLIYFLRYKRSINLTASDNTTNSDILAKEVKEIINKYSTSLKDVVAESGIPELQKSIHDYVNLKKRPQLYQQLNEDLLNLSRQLIGNYKKQIIQLHNAPKTTEELKTNAKEKIREDLLKISNQLKQDLDKSYREFLAEAWWDFEIEYKKLRQNTTIFMQSFIDDYDFSLTKLYNKAIFNRRDSYSTAPILSIFVEPFYSLSSQFQDFLVRESERVNQRIFHILRDRIQKKEYYQELQQLLGEEVTFVLDNIENEGKNFVREIGNVAIKISQQYIRESNNFYQQNDNDSVDETSDLTSTESFIEILRVILDNTKGKGKPVDNQDIENSIRELFRVQFSTEEHELEELYDDFRSQINVSFRESLDLIMNELTIEIPQQFDFALKKSNQKIDFETQKTLKSYASIEAKLETKIHEYNSIINGINNNQDWKSFQLHNLSTYVK